MCHVSSFVLTGRYHVTTKYKSTVFMFLVTMAILGIFPKYNSAEIPYINEAPPPALYLLEGGLYSWPKITSEGCLTHTAAIIQY